MCRSCDMVRPTRTILAAIALAALAVSPSSAQVWLTPSGFTSGPQVTAQDGNPIGGFLTSVPAPPSAALVDLPNGFRLTNIGFTYTVGAIDVGRLLNLTWQIDRLFLAPAAMSWQNFSQLDGTVTLPATPGSLVTDINLLTTSTKTDFAFGLADVGGASFVAGPNPFFKTGAGAVVTQLSGNDIFLQRFQMSFVPVAAGDTFSLQLPNSATSLAVPEPGSALALVAGLIGFWGFAGRRRR